MEYSELNSYRSPKKSICDKFAANENIINEEKKMQIHSTNILLIMVHH